MLTEDHFSVDETMPYGDSKHSVKALETSSSHGLNFRA